MKLNSLDETNAGDETCIRKLEIKLYNATKNTQSSTLWKLFFLLIAIQFIIPISIQIYDKRFWNTDSICFGRSTLEVELFSVLLLVNVIIYISGLISISKYKDTYGIKLQLFGIAFSWILIFIIGLLYNIFQFAYFEKYFYTVSIPIYLLPFFFESAFPLLKKKRAQTISENLKPNDLSLNEIKSYILYGDKDLADILFEYIIHVQAMGHNCAHIANSFILLRNSIKRKVISLEDFKLPFKVNKRGLNREKTIYKSSSYRTLRKSSDNSEDTTKHLQAVNSYIFLCMKTYFDEDGFLYIPEGNLTSTIIECVKRIKQELEINIQDNVPTLYTEKIHTEFVQLLRSLYDTIIWKFIIDTKNTAEFETFKTKILQKSLDIGITNQINSV